MNFITEVSNVSPSFTDTDGKVKYVVSHEVLEKINAKGQLFKELNKGYKTAQNKKAMPAEEVIEVWVYE